MAEKLKTLKLGRVSQLEFRTILPVALMEWKGLRVDASRWEALRPALQAEAQQLSERLLARLRRRGDLPGMNTLNLQSPEQVLEALQDLGLALTGTSEAQLRACAAGLPTGEPGGEPGAEPTAEPSGRQIVEDLLAYRHLAKLLGSTMQQVVQAILPETGRVHSSYHQIASASGRFACSEPNIQQVPREKKIRACFRPAEGYAFLIADYSQVELRVAAGLSGDATMLEAYRHGQDLHRLTAAITTNVAPEEVSKEARQAAKAINFGLIYAMGPQGLMQSARSSYGVEMTLEQATLFRNRFFQNYTGIRRWQEELERTGRKNRYIRTAAGRIRSYEGEEIRVTELFNVPVQGTAAEGLKSALCLFLDRVRTARLDAHVVAIIHDEIVVEVRQDQAEEALEILRTSMVEGIQWLVPGVPFAVDGLRCESWGDK
jgi:DNA polymerase I-like protein with 3'-5' exonuclease and polymerase domains